MIGKEVEFWGKLWRSGRFGRAREITWTRDNTAASGSCATKDAGSIAEAADEGICSTELQPAVQRSSASASPIRRREGFGN